MARRTVRNKIPPIAPGGASFATTIAGEEEEQEGARGGEEDEDEDEDEEAQFGREGDRIRRGRRRGRGDRPPGVGESRVADVGVAHAVVARAAWVYEVSGVGVERKSGW